MVMYARHRFDSDVAAPIARDGALITQDAVERAARLVAALDLSAVNARMMTMRDGPHWTKEQADLVEVRYRRFLQMAMLYPGMSLAPAHDIDLFWHEHILNTRAYISDCQTLFGHYLHHDAGFGAADDEIEAKLAYDSKTASIYFELFGEPYLGRQTAGHCTVVTCVLAEPAVQMTAGHCTVVTCVLAEGPAQTAGHCTVVTCVLAEPAAGQPTAH